MIWFDLDGPPVHTYTIAASQTTFFLAPLTHPAIGNIVWQCIHLQEFSTDNHQGAILALQLLSCFLAICHRSIVLGCRRPVKVLLHPLRFEQIRQHSLCPSELFV